MDNIEEAQNDTALGYIGFLNDRAVNNLDDGVVLMAKEDLEAIKEMSGDVSMTDSFRNEMNNAIDTAVGDILSATNNHVNAPLNTDSKNDFQQATKLIQMLVSGGDY